MLEEEEEGESREADNDDGEEKKEKRKADRSSGYAGWVFVQQSTVWSLQEVNTNSTFSSRLLQLLQGRVLRRLRPPYERQV